MEPQREPHGTVQVATTVLPMLVMALSMGLEPGIRSGADVSGRGLEVAAEGRVW